MVKAFAAFLSSENTAVTEYIMSSLLIWGNIYFFYYALIIFLT